MLDQGLDYPLFIEGKDCPYIRRALVLVFERCYNLENLAEEYREYDEISDSIRITPDYWADVTFHFDREVEDCSYISVERVTDNSDNHCSPVWVDSECEDWLRLMESMYNLY